MTLTITLEDEYRNVIELLDSELVLKPDVELSNYRLLCYLDPYGDTIFNSNQVDDLITDLQQLGEINESPVISQIISLAEKCKKEVHTCLCFNGD